MHAERDWLRSRVFPRLEEELRQRRHHLEPIDLRLGVETVQAGSEAARELLVLKVCLDEIKRSRPFLLVLLGDRYGWAPPEDRITDAAREQGFETSPAGKSVTALEIEFGILREDPTQKQRSLFFFREPLPYDQMLEAQRAIYSDAHSPDPQVRAGYAKLVALKDRLAQDPDLGPRVFGYRLGWDGAGGDVVGLEAFGELVFEKLWAVLEEETHGFAAQPPPTWEAQERAALAEFVEHRSRIFVGREELIHQLMGAARSPAVEGPMGSTTWGACVVGAPGSGKSAVFSKLHWELENERSILLLANAIGGTRRGASVDALLRRWIAELAAATGEAEPLPEKASPDYLEAAFYGLLRRVAVERRVVVLLDALDQFEPTPRGRHLTWFKPQQWPPNARIIATGLPCPALTVLSQQTGIAVIELPPLSAADAAGVGKQVWGRYHRELNPAVLRVLVDKKPPGGVPACGNPLWLTFALEQLNLLDADDFARAEREYEGSPTERMTALLLDTAGQMPADVGGLYGWLLEQNEKAFGAAHARGFAVAVALSRFGWRETDLLELAPRLGRLLFPSQTVPDLDALGLAALRRGFRAHLVRRGENGQLDFFHARMRRAMLEHCAAWAEVRQALHAAINDYLETLPAGDPLNRLERMGQLIGERNAIRAARYYATLTAWEEVSTERVGASWTLVEWIAAGESGVGQNTNLDWVTSWLDAGGLAVEEVHRLANNFQFGLFERMGNDVGLGVRLRLVEAVRATLQRLVASDPTNAGWQRDLSASYGKIGDMRLALGDLAGALQACREDLAVAERLVSADPTNTGWQRDLAVSHIKIGDVRLAQGDLAGALQAYREALAVAGSLVLSNPTNAGWQRDLSVSQERIGDVRLAQGGLTGALEAYRQSLAIRARLAAVDSTNTAWQYDLGISHERIGSALQAQGDLAGALAAFEGKQAIISRLAAADPTNAGWQRDLSASHIKIGDVLLAQGDLARALQAYREALAAAGRLALSDPTNAGWQRDLSVSHNRIGDLLLARGELVEALQAYREDLAISQRLAASDPTNAGWQRDLSVSLDRIGDVLRVRGDLARALEAYRQSLAVRESLAASRSTSAVCQRDLAVSHIKIGDVLRAQGDLAEALQAYRENLAISERLAASDSSNAGWQRDLASAHCYVGNVLQEQGALTGALQAYREYQVGMQRLLASDPINTSWQRDLSVSQERIGSVRLAQGDLAGALQAFREAQTTLQRLVASDPTNKGWQRDLWVSHTKIGDVLRAQDDLAGALQACRQSLAVAQGLVASDSTNTVWQRDLSVSHERIGDLLRAQDDLTEALQAYRQSLAVAERLAALDSANAGWQHDLSVSQERIGDVLLAQGDLARALQIYQQSLAVIQCLAASDLTNTGWQRSLAVSQNKIGDVRLEQGDMAGALRAYRETGTIFQHLATSDPTNAGWQRDRAASHYRVAMCARELGDEAGCQSELRMCFKVLDAMKYRNQQLDPAMARVYDQLAAAFGSH